MKAHTKETQAAITPNKAIELLKEGNILEIDLKGYLDDIEEIIKILTKIVKTSQQNLK